MQFASFTFLFLFLPISLGIYHLTPYHRKQDALLILSVLFLFLGGWISALLLLLLSGLTYATGTLLERLSRHKRICHLVLLFFVVLCVGLLFLLRWEKIQSGSLGFLSGKDFFPVGLSFFVLQCMGYCFDVSDGACHAEHNWKRLGLYLLFFPRMLQGPVVSYQAALKIGCSTPSLEQTGRGISRFIIGLSKKLLLAGWVGMLYQTVQQSDLANYSIFSIWVAAIAQLLSLFLELSGYADMAIGLGLCFGVKLPESYGKSAFFPSITTFAEQWNRTVVQWFSHYVGRQFHGKHKLFHLFAIVLTWSCIGLWYNQHLPALVFGVVIGVLIWFEHLIGVQKHIRGVQSLFTFLVLSVGAVLLTQSDWSCTLAYLQALFGSTYFTPGESEVSLLRNFGIVFLLSLFVASGSWEGLLRKVEGKPWFRMVRIPLSVLAILFLLIGDVSVLISIGGTAQMVLFL